MREKFKALKERFNSQSGFTLVELMATIAILALIVVIAIPAIGSIMNNAETGSYDSAVSMVEKSAQLAHISEDVQASSYTVEQLVGLGYLDIDIPVSYGDNTIDGNDTVTETTGGKFVFAEVE